MSPEETLCEQLFLWAENQAAVSDFVHTPDLRVSTGLACAGPIHHTVRLGRCGQLSHEVTTRDTLLEVEQRNYLGLQCFEAWRWQVKHFIEGMTRDFFGAAGFENRPGAVLVMPSYITMRYGYDRCGINLDESVVSKNCRLIDITEGKVALPFSGAKRGAVLWIGATHLYSMLAYPEDRNCAPFVQQLCRTRCFLAKDGRPLLKDLSLIHI